MSHTHDFLGESWRTVDAQALDARAEYNRSHPQAPILDSDVVVMAVLDGIAAHKRHHPAFPIRHYGEFTFVCEQLMRARSGKVGRIETPENGVACGWFPRDGAAACRAALAIRQHFVDNALAYRTDWPHERHAMCAVGSQEYAAYRLLQMGVRDAIVVDPVIWERLTPDLVDVLQMSGGGPPNAAARAEEVEAATRDNLEAAELAVAQYLAGVKGLAPA